MSLLHRFSRRACYQRIISQRGLNSAVAMDGNRSYSASAPHFQSRGAEAPAHVKDLLRGLGPGCAVCFDVDSTVITDEGIEVMAAELGCESEVRDLTSSAMDGATKFEDSLRDRLNIIRPNKRLIEKVNSKPINFSPGVQELIRLLLERRVDVHLVSGGFRQMIEPVATSLGLHPTKNVTANTLRFDTTGEYAGFDDTEPTSRSGGKARALGELKAANGYSTMVMVGDGATDLEARPPADIMIGYGGVTSRTGVREGCDWFVGRFDLVTLAVQGR